VYDRRELYTTDAVRNKLGNDFKITESLPKKTKVKIINVEKDELKIDDKNFLNSIKEQKRIETNNGDFQMRLLKRIKRINKEKVNDPSKTTKKEDSIIIMEKNECGMEQAQNI